MSSINFIVARQPLIPKNRFYEGEKKYNKLVIRISYKVILRTLNTMAGLQNARLNHSI
jgi:hypothetical protein